MAGTDFLNGRKLAARGIVGQSNVDLGVAVSIKYVGSSALAPTVIVTTATDVVLTDAAGAVTYTWAAYTTLGALVDKINSTSLWQAKVVDALRSSATGSGLIIDGAITAATNTANESVFNLLVDTSGALFMAYRLTTDRTFGTSQKLADSHRVSLKEVVTSLTLGGGADAGAFKIYETTPSSRGSVETLVLQRTPVTGSVSTFNFASGMGELTARDGNDLVIIISDGTSFATTDYITVAGIRE